MLDTPFPPQDKRLYVRKVYIWIYLSLYPKYFYAGYMLQMQIQLSLSLPISVQGRVYRAVPDAVTDVV